MQIAAAFFRSLADPTRLRLLRLLAIDRFNVSELTRALALAQSGVSRHLGFLREAGLVTEEREAGFVYYRVNRDGPAAAPLWPLLEAEFARGAGDRTVREDDIRLQDVLRQRRESFDAHADPRLFVPGRSWAAWARALGHLLPPLDVADIGCGDGYLTVEVAAWAGSVVAIDRSDDVLERARALGARRRITNVDWKKGDLARLPLREQSIDLALFSQSLRHASEPERAVADAARVLRPDGTLLIIERVMPERADGQPPEPFLLDMEMLVMTPGGRERTASRAEQPCGEDHEGGQRRQLEVGTDPDAGPRRGNRPRGEESVRSPSELPEVRPRASGCRRRRARPCASRIRASRSRTRARGPGRRRGRSPVPPQ